MASVVLAALSALVLVGAIHNSSRMSKNIDTLQRMELEWSSCEQAVLMLRNGSDLLTNSVYAFATTREAQYLYDYWEEAAVTKSRDAAYDALTRLELPPDELQLARDALDMSDSLLADETWAMRMICESLHMTPDEMPEAVASYPLSREDASLTPTVQQHQAITFLYGPDYSKKKQAILDDVSTLRTRLAERFSHETLALSATIATQIHSSAAFLLLLLLFLLVILALYFLLVNHPIKAYTELIARDQPDAGLLTLEPQGSREIRRFAERFNELTARLRKTQDELRLSEQAFRIASQQTEQVIQRYDIQNKTVYRSDAIASRFHLPECVRNMPDCMVETDIVAPESLDDFLSLYRAIQRGDETGSAFLRLRRNAAADGDYRWYQCAFTTLFDEASAPLQAIITYRDVTEQREKETVYQKWQQEIQALSTQNSAIFEYNLTTGALENFINFLHLGEPDRNLDFSGQWKTYLNAVFLDDRTAFAFTFNRERLLGAYLTGKSEFSLDFRARLHGKYLWLNAHIQLVPYPASGQMKAYIIVKDVDEKKRGELAIQERAQIDGLTKALNRAAFIDSVSALLANEPAAQHALFMLDLDGFKQVNDTIGHGGGDRCLAYVAATIKSMLRPGDLLGRIGGDEFMICLKNTTDDNAVRRRAALICERLHAPTGDTFRISVSLGAAVYSRDGRTFEELYQSADAAMYYAKHAGRNQSAFFDDIRHEPAGKNEPTPIDSSHREED